jgi:hypothetical protein
MKSSRTLSVGGFVVLSIACFALLQALCTPSPTAPKGPTLAALYDSTSYAGWAPDSGSEFIAYDTLTIWNPLDGGAVPYVQNGLVSATFKTLKEASLSDTMKCAVRIMDFGTFAKAQTMFNVSCTQYQASSALAPLSVSEAAYMVEAGGNITVYAHFGRFYFELELTGYAIVSDSERDALHFLSIYRSLMIG